MFVQRLDVITTHLLLPGQTARSKYFIIGLSPVLTQDLSAALKGALSGSLEALMLGLMKSTAQYDAFELKASMKVSSGGTTTAVVEHYIWPIRWMMTSFSYNI